MAAAPRAKSGTLSPNVPVSVTVAIGTSGVGNMFGVLNRSQFGTIWVRMDGENPAIGGDGSFPVLGYRVFDGTRGSTEVTIKLISDEALEYTVEGKDN